MGGLNGWTDFESQNGRWEMMQQVFVPHKVTDQPSPVVTPQPSREHTSSGAVSEIFAHEISEITLYSLNVEQPMKWKISSPFESVNLLVPSGITPASC